MIEGDFIMFAGRQIELRKLDGMYDSGKFECVVIHGRLRVGKTALLREFMKDKNAIYFAAQETSSRENLADLARAVQAFSRDPEDLAVPETRFDNVLGRVFELAKTQRLLLVIDDYEHLVAAHRGISGLIRDHIDKWFIDTQLMLIICGSSEPVMESETLNYDSPFHGRRTAKIRLCPFTFFETRRYYSSFSPFDIAIIYGITGGVPGYLELMDPNLPVEDNIRQAFFNASSIIFEEPANMLRRETRDPAYYNAVLRAIADGRVKNSEIASAVGLETSACTAYLKNLTALGLVSKHTPATEKAGKKTIYEIEDNMFRFWYRFVPENMSLIKRGMADSTWRGVAQGIPSFMSKVFEDICRQWVQLRNQSCRLPVEFVEVGRWWGLDPISRVEVVLPIIAYLDDSHALFGDCVWSDDPAGADALVSLEERSRLFRYPNRYLYLFSRSGFSNECATLAQRYGASLVTFE